MFPAQRIAKLMDIVAEKKTVNISTLCEELEVSDVTVRKYLDKLEQTGFLKKFHGGAMLVENGEHSVPDFCKPDYYPTESVDANITQITDTAVSLIEDGDTIFLGDGHFCLALSQKLTRIANLTVLTNNINAVPYIKPYAKNLYFIGGEIASHDNIFFSCGNRALSHLEGIFIQKAFYSVDGIDLMAGFTVNNLEISEFLRRINTISRQIIIMVDHSKFDRISLHQVSEINMQSIIVSDKDMDEKYKTYFFENNIKALTSYDI
jgi:DeoR family fructose operon transcriptional repressor